ncbi:unnamed protein product [Acanthoscelides obtectus]|uniref:Uncharacterized protein n=1 Tax=Acanthoscelides obtectus TaxID=200917 RepID=A0A9P0KMC2_ACAOB|nr:unnamed protein product [Acanthoscelides obtectus]CAK1654677.1 hypothetical protein AOBTE_LOCUS18761 [Acanthoscelides obtectus]
MRIAMHIESKWISLFNFCLYSSIMSAHYRGSFIAL